MDNIKNLHLDHEKNPTIDLLNLIVRATHEEQKTQAAAFNALNIETSNWS